MRLKFLELVLMFSRFLVFNWVRWLTIILSIWYNYDEICSAGAILVRDESLVHAVDGRLVLIPMLEWV
jgi:hypothetical protein